MIRKLMVVLLSGAISLGVITSALAIEYNEAPMLRTKVAAGELPPIEQRLPKYPKVVKVLNEIGTYGGTVRFGELGWQVAVCFANLEPLIEGGPTFSDNLVPNVVEKVDASPDGTTYTFHLREGLKWSDGVPVTTEDVLFKWEDVLLNEDITPAFPSELKTEEGKATLEVIDKYTFRVKFPSPYGGFLSWASLHYKHYSRYWMLPKHYMSQFHIKYTPLKDLEPLIREEGYEKGEWWKLFNRKAKGLETWDKNADIGAPVLDPWMVERKVSAKITTFVRNPYYWKVDREGNQLPYVDRLYAEVFTKSDMILTKIMAGEVDLQPEMAKFSDLPLLKQYAEKAGYKIMIFSNWIGSWAAYKPNYCYDDPVWREIIRDVRFRQALSLAIDRKNISDTVYLGFAAPTQVGLLSGSKYMEPWMFEAYAEYDPERANRILDEMGFKRGPDGIRLRPDGKKLSLLVDIHAINPYGIPITEMVVKYWQDIGIDATMKVGMGSLRQERGVANEVMIGHWHACSATDKEFRLEPKHHMPGYRGYGFGVPWVKWDTTEGKEGEEPPAEIKDLFEWRGIMKYSVDPQEVLQAGRAICRSQAENLWRIGVCSAPVVCIIKENLGNMPEKSPDPSVLTMSTNYDLEQVYWKK